MRHSRPRLRIVRLAAHLAVVVVPAVVVTAVMPVSAGAADSPSGFYFGSDSNGPSAIGSSPYTEPGTGGLYASYGGEIGTWTNWRNCTRGEALNETDVDAVNDDENANPNIPGLSLYWFMAGPGADPHYSGSTTEAYDWGQAQGERVERDWASMQAGGFRIGTHYVPLMFMDIEGQPEPGYANGWNEIVNSCGRISRSVTIPVSVDRATFNGFFDYVHEDTIFRPGVYSTPDFWDETFGTGSAGSIPNTYEWTPVTSTGRTTPQPYGFSQGSRSAAWFGGVSASHEAGWQWTENGGDWDQIDSAHLP